MRMIIKFAILTDETVVSDPSRPLICGIENCECEKTTAAMKEEYATVTFPYLDWSKEEGQSDRKDLIPRLKVELREVVSDFDMFYIYTWKAIIRKDVSAATLIEYLNKTELFHTFTKIRYPVIAFFHHLQPAFEQAKTLTDVLLILRDYIDVFSHTILVDILLNLGGSARDRHQLDDFRDKYYAFMRRKASLFPRVYGSPSLTGHALVYFTMKKDIDEITLSEIDSFANRLTYNMSITRFALKLLAFEREGEGLVSYVYQIPNFIRNFIFPLTDVQIHSMRVEGIVRIACCSYKVDISVSFC